MNDVIVLQDVIGVDWRRSVHLMSNQAFGGEVLASFGIPEGVAEVRREAGAFHLTATFGMRGLVCLAWQANIPAVIWELRQGETIRKAVADAAFEYALKVGQDPQTAWIERMPKGVEEWTPVEVGRVTATPLSASTPTSPQMRAKGSPNLGGENEMNLGGEKAIYVELISTPECNPGFIVVL